MAGGEVGLGRSCGRRRFGGKEEIYARRVIAQACTPYYINYFYGCPFRADVGRSFLAQALLPAPLSTLLPLLFPVEVLPLPFPHSAFIAVPNRLPKRPPEATEDEQPALAGQPPVNGAQLAALALALRGARRNAHRAQRLGAPQRAVAAERGRRGTVALPRGSGGEGQDGVARNEEGNKSGVGEGAGFLRWWMI